MKLLEHITPQEKEQLLMFPAYISLLATNNRSFDEKDRKAAMKFAHIKTYSSGPLLREYYREAERSFEQNITRLDNELPKGRQEREDTIKTELSKIEQIVAKLGDDVAAAMMHSMKGFKDHVSKAHRNVLEYFIFPMPIPGITD